MIHQVNLLVLLWYFCLMNTLFICDGNVARSQEAAIFFDVLTATDHSATSAGVNVKVGKPIDPLVVEVMGEMGHAMSFCYRKLIVPEMVEAADLVVSFKPESELPEWVPDLKTTSYWDVADPKGQPIEFHRAIRDEIYALTTELIATLDV